MKKIEVFRAETNKSEVIRYNGTPLDEYCTYCVITEELYKDNFSVELDLMLPEDNSDYDVLEVVEDGTNVFKTIPVRAMIEDTKDLLVNGSILKIQDEYNDYEIFRVTNVDNYNGKITLYGRQITMEDSLSLWIDDSRPENVSGAVALEKLYSNSIGEKKDFAVYSDISTTSTLYAIRKNLHEALVGDKESFLQRWGGEIERRKYKLSILKKRGLDRGVVFRRGKNYGGLEVGVNLDNLVTRIIPIGFDGISLPEMFVDSPKVGLYYNTFPREIKFEDIKYKDSPNNNDKEGYDTLEEAQKELRARAMKYFLDTNCDELKGLYNIEVVNIENTEEYKDLSIFERTWLGDYVRIEDEILKVSLKARVTLRKYDVIKGNRIQTEVTNLEERTKSTITLEELKDQLDNIVMPELPEIEIPNIDDVIEDVKNEVNDIMNQGLKDSYVITKKNEILVMDTKNINTAVKVLRINNNGIAGSTTGYKGNYNLAMTLTGDIIADRITTGVLNARLIKAGTLMSVNGNSWLDIDNGSFNWGNRIKFDGKDLTITMNSGQKLDTALEEVKSTSSEAILISNEVKVTTQGIENKITSVDNNLTKRINEIKSTTDGLMISVSTGGGNNLVANSSFDTKRDVQNRQGSIDLKSWDVTSVKNSVKAVNEKGNFLFIDTNGGWCDMETNLYFDCEPYTDYTISFDSRFATSKRFNQSVCFLVRENKTEYRFAEDLKFNYNWNRQNFTFTTGNIKEKLYIKLGFNADGYSWGAFDNVKVAKGTVKTNGIKITEWTPSANEIYQSTTMINEDGITVYGREKSSATFNYDGCKFRANNGIEGVAIDNGGIEVVDTNNGEFIGFIKSSTKETVKEHNGLCISSAGAGDYVSIGASSASRGDKFTSSEGIGVYKWKVENKYNPGVHFWDMKNNVPGMASNVYNHTHYEQTAGNFYLPSVMYLKKINETTPYNSWIGAISGVEGHLGMFGDNAVKIGILNGTRGRLAIKVEETSDGNNAMTHLYTTINMNGNTIINQRSAYTMKNTDSRKMVEEYNMTSDTNSTRYVFRGLQSKNGKIYANLPKKYSGSNYTITSIVKYGKGDVWVSEEYDERFVLECDNEMKVNIEIEIYLNEEVISFASLNDREEDVLPNDSSETVSMERDLAYEFEKTEEPGKENTNEVEGEV